MPLKLRLKKTYTRKNMPRTRHAFLNRKQGLYLASAGKKGRGVYCRTAIKKGELLETTPAILISAKETAHLDKTVLVNYAFAVGKLSKSLLKKNGLKPNEDVCCMVMGILSYCNHGDTPNAEVGWLEQGGSLYYALRATRNIPKGVEICTTYGDGWFDDHKTRTKA